MLMNPTLKFVSFEEITEFIPNSNLLLDGGIAIHFVGVKENQYWRNEAGNSRV